MAAAAVKVKEDWFDEGVKELEVIWDVMGAIMQGLRY